MRFEFLDYSLDAKTRELRAGGVLVPLEPKVFDLLHTLLVNRERVVSRDDLMAEVWAGRIVSDATIDARVNAARRAVGDSGGSQDIIKTVRGAGFRFVADVSVVTNAEGPAAQPNGQTENPTVPTVAVFPFALLDAPDGLLYVAQGLADDISTELGRFHCLAVLARDSTFDGGHQAGQEVEATRALGGTHCVRGSLMVSDRSLRLTVQLVDVEPRRVIWSERYDFAREEVFDVQDEIVASVVSTLFGRLTDDRTGGSRRRPTHSLDAYDCVLRGLAIHKSGHATREEAERAVAWFDRALALDPNYARAHAWRACAAYHLWPAQPGQSYIDRNMDSVSTALTIDPTDSEAHRIKGTLHAFQREFNLAAHHLEKARDLNPNDANLLVKVGLFRSYLGDHAAGGDDVELSMRRNPMHPDWYWRDRSIVSFGADHYTEAIGDLRKCHENRVVDLVYEAATLAALGELSEASLRIDQLRDSWPDVSLKAVKGALPFRCYKEEADSAKLTGLLRTAGLE